MRVGSGQRSGESGGDNGGVRDSGPGAATAPFAAVCRSLHGARDKKSHGPPCLIEVIVRMQSYQLMHYRLRR